MALHELRGRPKLGDAVVVDHHRCAVKNAVVLVDREDELQVLDQGAHVA
jgi:hypothetical protein